MRKSDIVKCLIILAALAFGFWLVPDEPEQEPDLAPYITEQLFEDFSNGIELEPVIMIIDRIEGNKIYTKQEDPVPYELPEDWDYRWRE